MIWTAGVDEVGRGPLAGPVVSAAVVLDPLQPIEGLQDSKILSEGKREQLFAQICQHAKAYALGLASVAEIDQLNILQATLLSMQRAVLALPFEPGRVCVDGRHVPPGCPGEVRAIVGGDGTVPCISAASIVAKVTRDRMMQIYAATYPEYGFAQHKGYGTRAHRQAIAEHGPCPIHRRSFEPVKSMQRVC